jgi:GT2 family glycosyltransferase
MTATHTLPLDKKREILLRTEAVDPENIVAVIPTYEDWDGLRISLDSLMNMATPPVQIVVANDNCNEDIPAWLDEYSERVTVINYEGNRGPAFGFTVTRYQLHYLRTSASLVYDLKGSKPSS